MKCNLKTKQFVGHTLVVVATGRQTKTIFMSKWSEKKTNSH